MVVRDDNGNPKRNTYGEFEYTERTANVRKQPYCVEIKDEAGRTIKTKHIFYTDSDVKIDDLLDGEVVRIAQGMITLVGNEIMKKVITS